MDTELGARKFELDAVSKLLRIPRRHITYLVDEGIVVPSYGASGKGSKRRFGVRNFVELAICHAVTELGCKAAVCKAALSMLAANSYFVRLANRDRAKEYQYVVINRKGQVSTVKEWRQVLVALHGGAGVVVDLDVIERVVANAVCG